MVVDSSDCSFFLLQELVSINPAKAAELVAGHFSSEVEPIITALQVSALHFHLQNPVFNCHTLPSSVYTVLR